MGPRRRPTHRRRLGIPSRGPAVRCSAAIELIARTELSAHLAYSARAPGIRIKSSRPTPIPPRVSASDRVPPFRRSPSLETLDLVERSLPFSESREIEAPGRGRGRILRTHPPSPPPPASRAPRPAADPASRQRPTRSKSGPAAPAASRAARSDGLPVVSAASRHRCSWTRRPPSFEEPASVRLRPPSRADVRWFRAACTTSPPAQVRP